MKITSLAAGAALLVGIVIGVLVDPYLPASISNAKKGYQSGFDAAKMLVASSSVGAMFNTPTDVRMLSGVVTAIDGNIITLRVGMTDPFGDQSLATRVVTVDASTTIVKLDVQTGSQTVTGKNPVGFPIPFTQTTTNLSGVNVGSPITVTAAKNVAAAREFTATEIQIQAQAPSSASSTTTRK
jgi:hypothetical protein